MQSLKSRFVQIITMLVVFFLTHNTTTNAQTMAFPFADKKYSFIKYDSAFLCTPNNNVNLERFFAKLSNFYFTGNEEVTILHLGDSHIQAGVESWSLRRHFEQLCHNSHGDYGLMTPLSAAPKNNHPFYFVSRLSGNWNYEKITKNVSKKPIGLSGFLAYTSDSIAEMNFVYTKRAEKNWHQPTKITLLHNISDTCYEITVNNNQNLIDCTTDFTNGCTEFTFSHALVDSISFRFVKQDVGSTEMHVHGVLVEDSLPNIKYVNIGTNGAATDSYVREHLSLTQLQLVKPDLAILALGVNDAASKNFSEETYIRNYQKIVDAVLQSNPNCAIIFVSNNDFCNYRGGTNQNQPTITKCLKQLATRNNASLFDLFNIMGGQKSIYTWQKHDLAQRDKIHFTNQGYMLVGDLIFGAILKEYQQYLQNITSKEQ